MSGTTTTKTTTTTTRSLARVQKTDKSIPHRLVGTHEYKNSILAFGELLKLSSNEDLVAYDRLLEERPEFTFYNGTNLVAGPTRRMRDFSGSDQVLFDNTYRKGGLAWMIALAKIELCATESLYGKSQKPFETFPLTPFDFEQYSNLLRDDASAHLKSLGLEPQFAEVTRANRPIDSMTLAYLRRLKLIRDMLTTLQLVTKEHDGKQQIRSYDRELEKYEKKLLNCVREQTQPKLTRNSRVGRRTTYQTERLKVSSEFIDNCQDIVDQSQPTGPSGYGNDSPYGDHSGPNGKAKLKTNVLTSH